MTDTAARVKSVIADCLDIKPDTLPDDLDDLGLDSLEQIKLSMRIEEELGCADISDEQIAELKSISEWVDMVVKHIGEKGAA